MVDVLDARYTGRIAILYVRQSSVQQVEAHEESRRLQYQMRERLIALGCRKILVIDEDLGKSASGSTERTGFARMVAEVGLGKVGIVAARDVSRLARNSRDWYQLIEICGIVGTLLVDHESVYDPQRSNDRLLLGMKGNLSTYELDVMRHRMVDARRAKAARGEMYTLLPVGYCKNINDRLEKNPDRRVQKAIELVFAKCLELGAIRRAVGWMHDHGLEVPVRLPGCRGSEHRWQPARTSNINRIVTNPIYCGAYVWGRTYKTIELGEDGRPRRVQRRRPKGEYEVLLHDHHEGYVGSEDFERLQAMLASNSKSFRNGRPGVAGRGKALLGGIVRCGRCGRPMTVGYDAKRRPHKAPVSTEAGCSSPAPPAPPLHAGAATAPGSTTISSPAPTPSAPTARAGARPSPRRSPCAATWSSCWRTPGSCPRRVVGGGGGVPDRSPS